MIEPIERHRQWRFRARKDGGTHVSVSVFVATASSRHQVAHATGAKVGTMVMRDDEWAELREGLHASRLNFTIKKEGRGW